MTPTFITPGRGPCIMQGQGRLPCRKAGCIPAHASHDGGKHAEASTCQVTRDYMLKLCIVMDSLLWVGVGSLPPANRPAGTIEVGQVHRSRSTSPADILLYVPPAVCTIH